MYSFALQMYLHTIMGYRKTYTKNHIIIKRETYKQSIPANDETANEHKKIN